MSTYLIVERSFVYFKHDVQATLQYVFQSYVYFQENLIDVLETVLSEEQK